MDKNYLLRYNQIAKRLDRRIEMEKRMIFPVPLGADRKVPFPAIVGPLLGLVYSLLLPSIVVAAFIGNVGYWIAQRVSILVRKTAHASI